MSGVGISRRGMLRCVPLDRRISYVDSWEMHPPFLFWSCQKRNGPCTVQREKTLRRVGLHRRRPPAAGGGRLAVPCGGQGRKRPALGETSSPGKYRDTPCADFRCRWPVVDESCSKGQRNSFCEHRAARSEAKRAERGAGQMRSCSPILVGTRAAGISRQICTAPRRARRPVPANTQAPSHADPRTATLHVCAKLRPKRFLSLDRARPVSLLARPKEKWGVHCPAINIADSPRPMGRTPIPFWMPIKERRGAAWPSTPSGTCTSP